MQVPADRREAMWLELKDALEKCDRLQEQNKGLNIDWLSEFHWTDDGKDETNFVIV